MDLNRDASTALMATTSSVPEAAAVLPEIDVPAPQ
jgi:hypothetical protein